MEKAWYDDGDYELWCIGIYWFKQGVLLPLITLLGLVGNCLSIMVLHSPGVDMKVLNKDGGVYVDGRWLSISFWEDTIPDIAVVARTTKDVSKKKYKQIFNISLPLDSYKYLEYHLIVFRIPLDNYKYLIYIIKRLFFLQIVKVFPWL